MATPAEFNAQVGGYGEAVARRHNLAMSAAFMAACWNNGSKTRLSELIVDAGDPKSGKVAQTPDEIAGALDAWVIATGGKLGGGKKKRQRRRKGEGN